VGSPNGGEMSSIAEGWYPDPSGQPLQRYWDGQDWTSQVRPYPPPQATAPASSVGGPEPHGTLTARRSMSPLIVIAAVVALLVVVGGALIWRGTSPGPSSTDSVRDQFSAVATPSHASTASVRADVVGPPPTSLNQIRELASVALSDVSNDTSKEVAISPDGSTAYVALEEAGAIQLVDLNTQTAGEMVFVGAEPQGVAVSPDGTRIYVAVYSTGEVVTIDAETLQEVNRVAVGGPWDAFNIAVSPDGSTLYVSLGFQPGIAKLDAETGASLGSLITSDMTDTNGVAVTPDGSKVYASDDQFVSIFDAASGEFERKFRLPDVERMKFSADGSLLLVSFFSSDRDGIAVLDATTDQEIGTILPDENVRGFAVNEDLSRVYISSYNLIIAGT